MLEYRKALVRVGYWKKIKGETDPIYSFRDREILCPMFRYAPFVFDTVKSFAGRGKPTAWQA